MNDFILPLISSVVTSIVTWLLTRRKYIAEVNTVDIESMKQSLEFYKAMSDDNKKRLEEYQDEIRTLKNESAERDKKYQAEINELRRQLTELTLKLIKQGNV